MGGVNFYFCILNFENIKIIIYIFKKNSKFWRAMAPTLTHGYASATNIYDVCNPFRHPPQSSVKHFRFMSQVQLLPPNIHVTNMNKSWHVKWKSLKFQGRSTKMITHQTLSLSLSHVISKLFVFVVLYEVWRVRS